MKLQNSIKFEKYNRLFTFGCSFTNYKWPMWPEILSSRIPTYYNFGEAGADNRTIFLRVLEADAVFNFQPTDLIIIMWTTSWRDTYFHTKKSFVLKRVEVNDLEFRQVNFFFRDLNYIKAILNFLENKNLDFDFLSMAGFSKSVMFDHHLIDNTTIEKSELSTVYNYYQPVIDQIKISMFESVYNFNWSRPPDGIMFAQDNYNGHLSNDNHPTPKMSFEYIKTVYPSFEITNNLIEFVNSYEEKISGKIIKERLHPLRTFQTILAQTCISYD